MAVHFLAHHFVGSVQGRAFVGLVKDGLSGLGLWQLSVVVVQLLDEFFGFVEVDCVGEEFLLIETVDDSQEDAADQRCGDSDADRDEGSCDLSSSLFEGLADQRGVFWEIS